MTVCRSSLIAPSLPRILMATVKTEATERVRWTRPKAAGPRTSSWTRKRRGCWMGRAGIIPVVARHHSQLLKVNIAQIKRTIRGKVRSILGTAEPPASSTSPRRTGRSGMRGVRGCRLAIRLQVPEAIQPKAEVPLLVLLEPTTIQPSNPSPS